MRVIFVDRAGAQSIWSLMSAIAEALARKGHQPVFCVFDDGRSPYRHPAPEGVEQIVIQVPPKRFLWDLHAQHRTFGRAFRELLRRLRPDVVHANFCVPGIAARWIAARERVPVVVSTQHELYGSMYPHYRWGLRLTERCADAVVYVSRTVARSFGRDGPAAGGGKTRHRVVSNGVDVEAIRAATAGAGRRIPGKLVCAGRMVRVKGQATLIRALPSVIAAHPQAHLTLIGAGPDEARLQRLVCDLGLQGHVRFAGWRPREDTLREMATAQAVVVPSDGTQEGFGLVLVEAMLCGTPVVASHIPVFQEVAGDGEVLWFPSGNVEALAVELVHALDSQAEPQAKIGKPVEEFYSIERMSMAYVELYTDLLGKKAEQEHRMGAMNEFPFLGSHRKPEQMPQHIRLELEARESLLRRGLYRALAEAVVTLDREGRLRVLDVGCGRGELLARLNGQGHEAVGVDAEPLCVEAASAHGRCLLGAVEDLPRLFDPDTFDAVVCSHVLEHLDAPAEALRWLAALRAKRYVFAVPNLLRGIRMLRAVAGSRAPDHPAHLYGWGRAEFGALLAHCGYEVISEHTDRVTLSSMPGRFGTWLSGILEPVEVRYLPRLFPLLSSSIIVGCRLAGGPPPDCPPGARA